MIEKIWKLTEKGVTDYNGKVGSVEEVVEVLNTYHFKVNDYLRENNKLREENEELKLDNDIKFWKQEYLQLSNHQQVIFHELAEAFKQGYKPSKEYQKMRNDEKKRIEECKQKMERLRI